MVVYQGNADGSWSKATPIGWTEEHNAFQRLLFWFKGVEHCNGREGRKKDRVLFWESPWSGDENDPSGLSYEIWVRLYWKIRKIRHFLNIHDWQTMWPLPGTKSLTKCTWCGKVDRG